MALELKRRGNLVTVATAEFYRAKVEGLGIGFQPIRPNWDPTDRELIAQCESLKSGLEVLYRKMLLPELKGTYDDLLQVAAGADLLIAGELVFAAPLVAEKLGLPWVSAMLSPFSFFSSHDPSVTVNMPHLIHLRRLGWRAYRAGLSVGRIAVRHWSNPVRRLRRELGLRVECDPVFRDKFSPGLVLALFTHCLAEPQPDWPAQTLQPGFVHYDREHGGDWKCREWLEFVARGAAPIVFTLGSTAVHHPADFFEVSAASAKALGRRAVLVGAGEGGWAVSKDILALPYAPYSEVFAAAAVVVHQGGSGTTGQALRAGRPMLVVPYGWDQPDNGARIERLGLGVCLPRSEYSVRRAMAALERLLGDGNFAARAEAVGALVRAEEGLGGACDAIEAVWHEGPAVSRR